jgi:hypothetical protein
VSLNGFEDISPLNSERKLINSLSLLSVQCALPFETSLLLSDVLGLFDDWDWVCMVSKERRGIPENS